VAESFILAIVGTVANRTTVSTAVAVPPFLTLMDATAIALPGDELESMDKQTPAVKRG
jgi:hypothetical protein